MPIDLVYDKMNLVNDPKSNRSYGLDRYTWWIVPRYYEYDPKTASPARTP